MFKLSLALSMAVAAQAKATDYMMVENVESFLKAPHAAELDVDYSVRQLGDAGVIACQKNCHLLHEDGARFLGNDQHQDWFVMRLGDAKDRSGLDAHARVAELSTIHGVEVHEAIENGNDTFVVLSTPDVFLLDEMVTPRPEKEVLTFAPKFTDGTALEKRAFSRMDDRVIQQIIDNLSTSRYISLLSQLTGETAITVGGQDYFTVTRSTTADLHNRAAEWAFDYFRNLGFEVFYQNFRAGSSGNTRNVIARKVGTRNPNTVVVVGAHYDSTSERASTLAPGAVDNGSGAVGVMLLAEQFANYQFENTIDFCLFGGEEQGLYGSQHYVDQLRSVPQNVITGLLMDMIGYSNRYYGVTIEGTTNQAIQLLMDNVEDNTRTWAPALQRNRANFSFGSDHVPFQRAGIPAILLIEMDDTNYPHYHRSTDTVDKVNRDQSVDILKGLTGAAVQYAVAV